jgi:hypothetical protein
MFLWYWLRPLREEHGRMEMLENRVLWGTSGPMNGSNMKMKKTIQLEN